MRFPSNERRHSSSDYLVQRAFRLTNDVWFSFLSATSRRWSKKKIRNFKQLMVSRLFSFLEIDDSASREREREKERKRCLRLHPSQSEASLAFPRVRNKRSRRCGRLRRLIVRRVVGASPPPRPFVDLCLERADGSRLRLARRRANGLDRVQFPRSSF